MSIGQISGKEKENEQESEKSLKMKSVQKKISTSEDSKV